MSEDRQQFDKQVGVWDRMSAFYENEIDVRFEPIVRHVTSLADPDPEDEVLDLGTGTGSLALKIAPLVKGVVAVDISPEMLEVAAERTKLAGLGNVSLREGRAESIPEDDASFDTVVSSLCLMFVSDKKKAATEIARVLRQGGRFVASVWGGGDECDIVKFQSIAGSFSPDPPDPGSGPGSLSDLSSFNDHLSEAGLRVSVEERVVGFGFPDLETAWNVLAGVTTANLSIELRERAIEAVQAQMWPEPERPREFNNLTRFIIGEKRSALG